ncbi:MAG: hypothetical protein KJ587_17120 [Alphaproteobacteria bacterium]|nr:hypothetical protein [Alphaproteobacteria bacterium]
MSHDEAAWADIRCAYEKGEETVSQIAARLAVSAGAIYRRARRDGWARRSQQQRNHRTKAATAKPCRTQTTTGDATRRPRQDAASAPGLITRLYNAMDAKLKRLEARMDSHEELTAAESERETRELGSMIRSFEKVTAFAAVLEEREKPSKRKHVAAGDAERMREEITQRLGRLCADRDAKDRSGTSE